MWFVFMSLSSSTLIVYNISLLLHCQTPAWHKVCFFQFTHLTWMSNCSMILLPSWHPLNTEACCLVEFAVQCSLLSHKGNHSLVKSFVSSHSVVGPTLPAALCNWGNNCHMVWLHWMYHPLQCCALELSTVVEMFIYIMCKYYTH